MKPTYINSEKEFEEQIQLLESNKSVQSVLILMAEENNCKHEVIEPIIKKCTKTIIGGIFPQVIFESQLQSTGIVFVPLAFKLDALSFDFNQSMEICTSEMNDFVSKIPDGEKTLYLFVDAFGEKKDIYIDCIFNFFGTSVKYIGGCCGSITFKSCPCVITNDGILENAGIFAVSQEPITLGVAHGWKAISDPFKVTTVESNKISSLNWEPAYEVYKKTVEQHSGQKLENKEFYEIAKSYPLGIVKIDGDYSIRQILSANQVELICSDRVELLEYVSVMYADKNDLLFAADEAMNMISDNSEKNNKDEDIIFCVDCIARKLFLDTEFSKELDIFNELAPVYGVISLGEIANHGNEILEVYNNTIALASWKKK
ncbi:MAG: FIST C-terminal domain-containing protein [Paludibacter sp.]